MAVIAATVAGSAGTPPVGGAGEGRQCDQADEQGVSARTIGRDIDRLRLSGVPLVTTPGRGGVVRLAVTPAHTQLALTLDLPEVPALLSSLTNLGPTATPSAASAMRKLTAALGLTDAH